MSVLAAYEIIPMMKLTRNIGVWNAHWPLTLHQGNSINCGINHILLLEIAPVSLHVVSIQLDAFGVKVLIMKLHDFISW